MALSGNLGQELRMEGEGWPWASGHRAEADSELSPVGFLPRHYHYFFPYCPFLTFHTDFRPYMKGELVRGADCTAQRAALGKFHFLISNTMGCSVGS